MDAGFAARLAQQSRLHFDHYIPHEKQKEFHGLGLIATERACFGGNRSGKTLEGTAECSQHITGRYKWDWNGYRYNRPIEMIVASNTTETTRDIAQDYYLGDPARGKPGLIDPSLIIRTTKKATDTVGVAYIRHISGGISKIKFKSYDQGREKFQGTKEDLIHFDEEPPMDVYTEALMRLAGVGREPGHMILTMTPLKGRTELVMRFLGEGAVPQGVVRDGRAYLSVSWDDNPHITEEEKARLRKNARPNELEARERGIPSVGTGLVYPVLHSLLLVDPFDIPKHWPRVFGMDFGWVAPTAVVFLAHDRDSDIIYVYSEYAASEMTPQSHANELFKMGVSWIPGICDPAGRQSSQLDGENLVNLYRKAGLNLTPATKRSDTKHRLELLQRMQNGKLKIFKTLPKLINEISGYGYNEKGQTIGSDHLLDAMLYASLNGLGAARLDPSIYPMRGYSAPSSPWAV